MGITEIMSFNICELFKLFVLIYLTFKLCLNSFEVNNNSERWSIISLHLAIIPLITFRKSHWLKQFKLNCSKTFIYNTT